MTHPTDDLRLRLFAFTQAEHRRRYLAMLARFDEERERSRLQLAPSDLVGDDPLPASEDDALTALDQLHGWGLLDRLQDDRRVRTIAEYRQRRSVYQVTELGWLAWKAVNQVLEAEPGEAELRKLVLARVEDDLGQLAEAVESADGEKVEVLLEAIHGTLQSLAEHAARFTLATSELASAWEADPATFLAHKNLLLGHLDGFLTALTAHHPRLAAATAALDAQADTLIDLAVGSRVALAGSEQARKGVERHWQGVLAWFVDRPHHPSQATLIQERTNRAIRDLAVLLRRVLDATAGGVSRATQLEDLARWIAACPTDEAAEALVGLLSGLQAARHFGAPDLDPDTAESGESWWAAQPAPVDTTLRQYGRTSSPGTPKAVPDKRQEKTYLRRRQEEQRRREEAASLALIAALAEGRILEDGELRVLLRLLSRALTTRSPVQTSVQTVRGRLRLLIEASGEDCSIPTRRGTLRLAGHRLEVSISSAPRVGAALAEQREVVP